MPNGANGTLPASLDWYRSAASWTVGLSSGAIAFGIGFHKDLAAAAQQFWVLFCLLPGCFLLGVAAFAGTFSYYWLVDYANKRDINEHETEDGKHSLSMARGGYVVMMHAFGFGIGFLAAAVFAGLLSGAAKAEGDSAKAAPGIQVQTQQGQRFVITSTGTRVSASTESHAHAFLLDTESGDVWHLVCKTRTDIQFRRVEVEGRFSPEPAKP